MREHYFAQSMLIFHTGDFRFSTQHALVFRSDELGVHVSIYQFSHPFRMVRKSAQRSIYTYDGFAS